MRTKPNRVYHKAWDKYGDVLATSGNWITCRFDGEKGTNCYEVDAPYIKTFIDQNKGIAMNITDEMARKMDSYQDEYAELSKDKERLEWLMRMVVWASSRVDIDRMMDNEEDE